MRIGFISQALPYLPSRGGFRLYGGNLIRQLGRRHSIDLVSLLVDEDARHLDWARAHCASVQTISADGNSLPLRVANEFSAYLWGNNLPHRRRLMALLRAATRDHPWDVLHVEGGFAGGLVDAGLPVAKILSLHDSWTLRCDEMLRCAQDVREWLYYRLLRLVEPRYERLVYPRFERCTVVAERDAEEVRRVVPEARVDLIPYGTDTEYFHPVPVEKEPHALVFHGHLGYAPNIEAALEFANDVFPLVRREVPEAVFHLVGASPASKVEELAAKPSIRLSANLPDLRRAVCSAQVYVCAIRHGTGLKSKMLEAMAMRLPIVCYPGSTVGLEGVAGRHYLVAQTPREFADHVLTLLRGPGRAQHMAQAGRELVEERYSWESRARVYDELYERAIEERRTRQE
ncbi:MAG: glycosyltransferase [Candidatus Rokubacteria bacterium]|nr:glycosyltransferase [Candidatus Rokubacteria bacterium]